MLLQVFLFDLAFWKRTWFFVTWNSFFIKRNWKIMIFFYTENMFVFIFFFVKFLKKIFVLKKKLSITTGFLHFYAVSWCKSIDQIRNYFLRLYKLIVIFFWHNFFGVHSMSFYRSVFDYTRIKVQILNKLGANIIEIEEI